MPAPSPTRPYAPLVALILAALLGPRDATADPLVMPDARHTDAVTTPHIRIEIDATGRIVQGGQAFPPSPATELRIPRLAETLGAWHATRPDGLALIAADPRADFRVVRQALVAVVEAGIGGAVFLASPDAEPRRGIRIDQSFAAPDTAPESVPPLTVHLRADGLVYLRRIEEIVTLPRVGGALDAVGLAALLDEDRRLHRGSRFAMVNTDDGVAYGDMYAALEFTRTKGFDRTLLAGGPPVPQPPPPAPYTFEGPIETPSAVTLHPDGDTDLRGAGGALDLVRHAAVTDYEAHCDATTCDIVLRAGARRAFLGARPRNVPVPGWLFGRPVHARDGRLGLAEPTREGRLSPLVALPVEPAPGEEAPTPPTGARP